MAVERRPPRAPPTADPTPLNNAFWIGSPFINERTTLMIDPMTGTLRNLPIFPNDARALTPPLPPTLLAIPVAPFLRAFVAPDLPYFPPRLFTASLPNLFSAASLPNLLVNLLAAAGEVVLVRPTLLPPIPVVFGPPRPPRPKESPPPPPRDAIPAMMAMLANVVNADNNPSNLFNASSPPKFSTAPLAQSIGFFAIVRNEANASTKKTPTLAKKSTTGGISLTNSNNCGIKGTSLYATNPAMNALIRSMILMGMIFLLPDFSFLSSFFFASNSSSCSALFLFSSDFLLCFSKIDSFLNVVFSIL